MDDEMDDEQAYGNGIAAPTSKSCKRSRLSEESDSGFCESPGFLAASAQSISASEVAGEDEVARKTPNRPQTYIADQLASSFQKIALSCGVSLENGTAPTRRLDSERATHHHRDADSFRYRNHGNNIDTAESLSVSDVEMTDMIQPVKSRRTKFDRIRLDDYRSYLADIGGAVVTSVHSSCFTPDSGSSTNNSNTNPAVNVAPTIRSLTDGAVRALRHDRKWKYAVLPPSPDQTHAGIPCSASSAQFGPIDNTEKIKRSRKRVSFTGSPSIKWFQASDVVRLPSRIRKSTLFSVLKQLVVSRKLSTKEKNFVVVPILKKRKHEKLS